MDLPPGLAVGLYGRKSAKDEAGTEASSILVQYARGETWADRHGLQVTARWADNLSAWSGKERPEFNAALAALERGDIDVLWVYGSDRFTRQGAQAILGIMDRPIASRPKIFFDHESLCTWEEAHRFPLVVKAEVDRQYADRLSKNVLDTKIQHREQGIWSTKPPYGLRRTASDPGKLEPDPDTWPVIVRIYELAARGASRRSIASTLNRDGVASPAGAGWANATVRLITCNPVYEGWMIVKSGGFPVLYLNKHGNPVRVFADDAEPLPAELVRLARLPRQHTHRIATCDADTGRNVAPLNGVLYCAACGSRMHRSGGPTNRHYRCRRFATGQGCPAPASVLARSIEPYVVAQWTNIVGALDIADDEDHAALATMGARWYATETPPETARAARETIAFARKRLARLREDRELGLWDDDPSAYAERVKAAQRALQDAEAAAGPDVRLPDFAGLDHDELVALVDDGVPPGLRRDLFAAVLDAVVVKAARYRGQPWTDARVVAVVPASAEPRAVAEDAGR